MNYSKLVTDEQYEQLLATAVKGYESQPLDDMIPLFKALHRARPKDSRPAKLLGSGLFLENRLDEAERAYEEAYRLEPSDPYTLVALGEIKLLHLKLDEAARYLRELVQSQSHNHPCVLRGRKILEERFGNLEEFIAKQRV